MTRYWVGGSGTWDTTSTTNWSATSGGAGGASVPTSTEPVYFNELSGTGSYTVTLGSNVSCGIMTFGTTGSGVVTLALDSKVLTVTRFVTADTLATGGVVAIDFGVSGSIAIVNPTTIAWDSSIGGLTYTGTFVAGMTTSSAAALTINLGSMSEAQAVDVHTTSAAGFSLGTGHTGTASLTGSMRNLDLTGYNGILGANLRTIYGGIKLPASLTTGSAANPTTFAATSGSHAIDTNGAIINFPVVFNGAGGSWYMASTFTQGGTRGLTLDQGSLNLNSQAITVGAFRADGTLTRSLTMGAAQVLVTASSTTAWDTSPATNMTFDAGTSIIQFSNVGTKTMVTGGLTFYRVFQGGEGRLTISGGCTIYEVNNTVPLTSVRFTSGQTYNITVFGLGGTAGNLVTIDSTTAGSQHILNKTEGLVTVSYCSIKDSKALGNARWEAYNTSGNVDFGNNTNWLFESIDGNFLFLF